MEQPEKAETPETNHGDTHVSDDLQQRVIEVLQQDSLVEDENIIIQIKKNNLIELSGSVPDQEMIERATELIRGLGELNIENALFVRALEKG